ncbi:High mobility group, superfamily [Metarhizium album ARSEF 1941]|uniref:High mobility group, superfamily n=1 Tax=Metarhizium album (strain ARSEF 1941) TaxID=1081103 RepID=A0A0B2WYT9_METAS|nr:High mobility group, superfamily [Metarhizium album ARSEF 1941]KHN98592.1 High mobility group, superfamily [Metarhizium album ARSEF 1941]
MNCQPQQIHDSGHNLEMPSMTSPEVDIARDRNNMRTGRATPAGVSERANLSRASMTTRNEPTSSKSLTTGRDSLITVPLSSVAKAHPHDYIDPEEYAKRPVEERQRKAKEEGKVSRPLNSYMLYRKAFQQIARRVLSNDQQQFASQIVGISWNNYESKDIKDQFKALAKIDNQMHRKAFPTYKYTPTQGRKPRSGAPDSKKLSTAIERRVCRRFGNKDAYSHGASGKKLVRPNHVEALGQHQSSEGNMDIKWWTQEPPSFANPLMHHGRHDDRFEQHFTTDSMYFEPQYPDVLDEAPFSQLPSQSEPLAASPCARVGAGYMDPNLFKLENMSMAQNPGSYMEWGQPQEAQVVHDYPPLTPDINAGQANDPGYEGPEEWSVQHLDEGQNAFGWHTTSEQRSR